MWARRSLWCLLVAASALAGCDDATESDAGLDGGPPRDAGPGLEADAGPPNQAPTAALSVARTSALTVDVDASESVDPDGAIVSYTWEFGDGARGDGVNASHAYAAPGCYEIRLTVTDDGGLEGAAAQTTRVIGAPSADAGSLSIEGLPRRRAVLARDRSTGAASLTVRLTGLDAERERAVLRVLRDGEIESEASVELCAPEAALTVTIPAERRARDVELVLVGLGDELVVDARSDLLAGDFLVVTGQSNAVSGEFNGSADENLSPFVRSFGTIAENPTFSVANDDWHDAGVTGGAGHVGQWPLRMAAVLSERLDLPIAVINGARGGRPIGYFQRNDADPEDVDTNYGRLLRRVRRVGAAGAVRAILWYQGESDGADFTAHHDGFVALHEDWRADYPNVERTYVTQIRLGCGGQVATRDVQRRFADELPDTSVMSTTGLDGHDGCHYAYVDGYRELGDRYAELLARDLFGAPPAPDTEAVNVDTATLAGDEIVISTRGDASALVVDPGVEAHFTLTGTTRTVAAVRARGLDLVVTLGGAGPPPRRIAYVGQRRAGPWITNAGGVGLLAFLLDL